MIFRFRFFSSSIPRTFRRPPTIFVNTFSQSSPSLTTIDSGSSKMPSESETKTGDFEAYKEVSSFRGSSRASIRLISLHALVCDCAHRLVFVPSCSVLSSSTKSAQVTQSVCRISFGLCNVSTFVCVLLLPLHLPGWVLILPLFLSCLSLLGFPLVGAQDR